MKAETLSVLKRDALGRVELLRAADGVTRVRRVAAGGRIPGSRLVARILLAREARALARLAQPPLEGVPRLFDASGGELVREFVEGQPLSRTETLAPDFFERLAELVGEMHARGVCHNDLHKEQNVIVGPGGFPFLVDFQLASVHEGASRARRVREREDLRHVEKHRRRYLRDGRGPQGASIDLTRLPRLERSPAARVWRRVVKPVYVFVTRRLLGTRDGEARRASNQPFPRWTAPLGPRRAGGR